MLSVSIIISLICSANTVQLWQKRTNRTGKVAWKGTNNLPSFTWYPAHNSGGVESPKELTFLQLSAAGPAPQRDMHWPPHMGSSARCCITFQATAGLLAHLQLAWGHLLPAPQHRVLASEGTRAWGQPQKDPAVGSLLEGPLLSCCWGCQRFSQPLWCWRKGQISPLMSVENLLLLYVCQKGYHYYGYKWNVVCEHNRVHPCAPAEESGTCISPSEGVVWDQLKC